MFIKDAADPLRHGDIVGVTGKEREKLLIATWEIVDSYLKSPQLDKS